MPAKRLPWQKFWPELVDHEKFVGLTDSEAWTWVRVYAKAGQQPKRGRFASVKHAAVASGRSERHIRRLIAVRLIDETTEGLLMHDWEEWQRWRKGDESDDGSTPESPSNDTRTPTERHTNVNAKKEKKEGEKEKDVDRETSEPGQVVPERGNSGRRTAPATASPEAKALVDAFYEAMGVEPHSLTATQWKREVAIAQQLSDSGATPDEARQFVAWCRAKAFRPVPSDLRTYEQKRARFLANLDGVEPNEHERNGTAAAEAEMGRKFAHLTEGSA